MSISSACLPVRRKDQTRPTSALASRLLPVYELLVAQAFDRPEGPWDEGRFRLFISHVSSYRHVAGELQEALASYGIDGFVAHDDIEPTRIWEEEIVRALQSCDAMAVLLGPDAHQSNWLDQETGWALARSLLIIPVNLGLNPYGFVAGIQALPGANQPAEALAEQIFDLILRSPRTGGQMVEALVRNFERSDSFASAKRNFIRLLRVQAFSPDQLKRLERAYRQNDQVANTFFVQDRIDAFLERHWAVYDEEEEE